MKWKESLPFLSPKFVTRTVNGESVHFYPVSVGLVFKLRILAEPVARAIASLFSDTKRDSGSQNRNITFPDGNTDTEFVVEPVSIELARFREERKDAAITDLVKAVTDENTLKILADIIKDSMREIFLPENRDNPPASELIASIPTPIFIEMVCGAIAANQGILGPLLAMFPKLPETLRKKVSDQLNINQQPQ